jgi:transcriptional regulator GlxA family with amidase domain
MGELIEEWNSNRSNGLLPPALFLRMLVHLAFHSQSQDQAGKQERDLGREEIVSVAVRYMEENFRNPLRMDDIADVVFLSTSRFTDIFATIMGRNPSEYLRYLRIEYSKALLTGTNMRITDIAMESGFSQPEYFARVFHQTTDMTPRQYRRLMTKAYARA